MVEFYSVLVLAFGERTATITEQRIVFVGSSATGARLVKVSILTSEEQFGHFPWCGQKE
jgi:hypothetical protein